MATRIVDKNGNELIPNSDGSINVKQTAAPSGTSNVSVVSSTAPSNASTSAYAASLVIKNSSGTLYGVTIHNSKASSQFIQLHNTTSVPADTAVPVLVISLAGSTSVALDWGIWGRAFSTGITICNSSTGPTKTIGSADCYFDAQYV